MEWVEGRITKRSVDAAKAPETRHAITELAYKADKLDLSSARERILELALKHQHSGSHVENLKAELSVCYATNRGFRQQLEAEMEANGKLSAELKHELEENERLNAANEKLNAAVKHECKDNEKLNATLGHQREENERINAANEKLDAAVKHECKNNEKLNATLRHEREENERLNAANEKLNAALKFALLENAKLNELTRSLREQSDGLDGLRAVLEIIADEIKPKTRRRRLLAPTNTGGPSLLTRGAPAHP
jgi:chromosome segregation ATPase